MAAVFERLLGGAEIPEDIHSPIGLPIGAQGPEEIAVSILVF
jgi:xanthine dehydrogenase accessory factor